MASIISPNMSLIIPGVGTEQGPDYAFDINASLTLIDQHDHSPGKGIQITPAGLNINVDFSINSNSLTDVKSIVFTNQSSNISTLQALYVTPGTETPTTNDLWFNDGNGNQVQLTSGGTVNATIANLPGESYAAGTFTWKQGDGSTTPANFDIGSITIRPNVAATSNGVTLTPPSGISSQYTIALPLLPASQKIVTLDNSGNMVAAYTVDGSTIVVDSNVIKVPAGGITKTQLSADILQWNTATITSSGTFTVPAGVNQLHIIGCGGGGGGGGAAAINGAGGSGGAGATPQEVDIIVTAAQVLTVTIGGAGGGGGNNVGGNGGNGTSGSATTITGTNVDLYFPGGAGGVGGTNSATQAPGNTTSYGVNYSGLNATSGGSGGFVTASVGSAGTAGFRNAYTSTPAVAGSGGSNSGGGGGGGGSGFGAGGAGGNSTNSSSTGSPGASATNRGAGGGGGGGNFTGGSNAGGIGGAGFAGQVKISWLGTP